MSTIVTTWLRFALQQMAAESYLDGINILDDDQVEGRLLRGNNRQGFDPPSGILTGATRFTSVLADQFLESYQLVDHHANDSTGFSATLMQEIGTNNFTLSFRSTEYQPLTNGGDRQRDLFGADAEISLGGGFAVGQLLAMETYYQSLKDSGLLPTGAVLNVTGYSLGGHLATVFTELHTTDINHTYTFNGVGRGHITGGLPTETTEAEKIAGMLAIFKQVLFNPDSGLEIFNDRDNVAYNAAKQIEAQPFIPFVSDTAIGSAGSIYSNARYAWATQVVAVRYHTSSLSLPPGVVGTSPAFSSDKFTQLYGHATQDDSEYVANSGVHGPQQAIYIEDQPNFDGIGGFFGGNGDYGTTHSITLIVDSLATQELFQTIAPTLTQSDIEAIFAAASNQRASGFVGISGTAEGNSLENALDALGKLFVPNYTQTAFGRQTGDFGSLGFRNPFYENMVAIKAALSNITMTIEPFVEMGVVEGRLRALPRLTEIELVAEALQDTDRGLAFRYALENLNPFAVIGADYQELGHASNGQLALYNPATGFGQMTEQYLVDRAAFLGAKIELNLRNATTSGDTIHFKDFEGNGHDILTGSLISIDQEFLFGSDNDDPPLVGGSQEDHLYGGDGQDLLDGQDGRDYLEGNDGADVLMGGAGRDILMGQQGNDILDGGDDDDRLRDGLDDDEMRGGTGLDVYYLQSGSGRETITDSDGRGVTQMDQRLLVGGMRKPTDPAQTYTSLDGQFVYVRSGSTLTIMNQQNPEDQIVVENYAPEQLGIRLVDVPSASFQNNGLPTKTNDDFLTGYIDETGNRLTLDGPFNFAIHVLAGNDNVVGGSGNDQLFGDGGTDTIDGMEGHDGLYGGAEGDILRGGAGDDWLLGGNGDDDLDGGRDSDYLDAEGGDGVHLLSGGTGSDILVGGAGRDLMYGDTRDHSLISEGGDDLIYGGAGDDGGQGYGLQGGAGSDIVIGGEGNDWVLGDGPNNTAIVWDVTYDGRDWLDGGPGDDALVGGANDDILVGGPGADHLSGDYNNVLFQVGGNDLLDGGDDADTLIGGVGNDTLYGGVGDDVVYGDNNPHLGPALAGGDDFLDGEAGNDQLFGGMGSDIILGGLGSDRLYGEDGNDVLDGGIGNDNLDGGAGFDTIHGGAGNDRLVGGYSAGDSGGLIVSAVSSFMSDSISEGTDLRMAGANSGMDQLYGDEGDDYLISASEALDTDDSLLVGGSGDDTYEIDGLGDVVTEVADDGIDTVISYLSSYTLADHLENLSFRGLALIGVGNSLNNVLSGGRSLEGLGGDDTLIGVGRLDGGTGNDILQGGSGTSYFGEDDVLHSMANAYVFSLALGQDRIIENDAIFNSAYYQNEDRILFTEGIAPAEVTWERSSNDLIFSVGVGADRITIPSYYDLRFDRGGYQLIGQLIPSQGSTSTGGGFPAYIAPSRIELVQFTDGTVWDAAHFGAPLLGDVRADTYHFERGSGDVSIIDFDFSQSNATRELDSILLDADLLPSDLTACRVGDDLALSVNGTTDRLNIQSFFKTVTVIPPFSFSGYSVAPYRIEQVQFADGTLWTASDLTNRISTFMGTSGADTLFGNQLDNVIQGLSGEDYLSGQDGDDVLDGGAGNDRLFGDAGNDTYLFGRGGGQDILVSYDGTGTETEVVRLGSNVLPSHVTIQVVGTGNDLVLRINGTNDQLVLDEFLWRSDYQIDWLEFDDGTVWDAAMIFDRALGLVLVGANVNETLRGSMLNDVLDGVGGSDLLIGNEGDDRLFGGQGNDEVFGGAGDDTYVFNLGDGVDSIYDEVVQEEGNRILFGPGIAQSDLAFMRDDAQRTLTIQVGGSSADRLQLNDFDPTGAEGSLVVATLVFADGSTLNLADLFPPNHAPMVINPLVNQTALEDAPFSFLIPSDTFADEDAGDVLTMRASLADGTALPSWLTFDSASGIFSGTPDDAHVGTLDLRVTATDPNHESVFDMFTLAVINVNETPAAGPLADQTAIEDTAFTFTVPASTFADVDQRHGDTLTYHASLTGGGGLPAWLTFDAASREFSGVPGNSEVGTLAITVTATDSENLSVTTGFSLAVQNANDAPAVAVLLSDQMTAEDSVWSFTIPGSTFVDPDQIHGDGLSYSATLADGTALPAWLTFSPVTGAFSGMPGPGDAGNLQIVVMATDTESLMASDQFALIISGPLPTTLVGTTNPDALNGGRGDDTLSGLAGNDLLMGGPGNDLLDGGTGGDTMQGGTGNDTYTVDAAGDFVTELPNGGTDTVWTSISYTLPNHVEHLILAGTAAIKGTGNAMNNILTGNSVNNTLHGGAGNDRLDGRLGSDTMIGGTGDDVYVVNQVGDVVTEVLAQGTDTVESSVTYTLGSNVENLTLTGPANVDGSGNSLNNTLIGNGAVNTLDGASGNDSLYGEAGDDSLFGGSGDDQLYGGQGGDSLNAGSGNDLLNGGDGIDMLDGGSGDDQLIGGAGSDLLVGGSGSDQFTAGSGDDTVTGGSGNDLYNFSRGDGQDRIVDSDASPGNSDHLIFGTMISPLDLVLSRQANDLRLAVHGSEDSVTIQNWYTSQTNQVENLEAGNGLHLMNTQVNQLIQSMATFSQQSGLTWDQAIDQRPQDVQTVLAASWR